MQVEGIKKPSDGQLRLLGGHTPARWDFLGTEETRGGCPSPRAGPETRWGSEEGMAISSMEQGSSWGKAWRGRSGPDVLSESQAEGVQAVDGCGRSPS